MGERLRDTAAAHPFIAPHESDEDGLPCGDEVAGARAGHQRGVDAVGHVGHLDLAPARVGSV